MLSLLKRACLLAWSRPAGAVVCYSFCFSTLILSNDHDVPPLPFSLILSTFPFLRELPSLPPFHPPPLPTLSTLISQAAPALFCQSSGRAIPSKPGAGPVSISLEVFASEESPPLRGTRQSPHSLFPLFSPRLLNSQLPTSSELHSKRMIAGLQSTNKKSEMEAQHRGSKRARVAGTSTGSDARRTAALTLVSLLLAANIASHNSVLASPSASSLHRRSISLNLPPGFVYPNQAPASGAQTQRPAPPAAAWSTDSDSNSNSNFPEMQQAAEEKQGVDAAVQEALTPMTVEEYDNLPPVSPASHGGDGASGSTSSDASSSAAPSKRDGADDLHFPTFEQFRRSASWRHEQDPAAAASLRLLSRRDAQTQSPAKRSLTRRALKNLQLLATREARDDNSDEQHKGEGKEKSHNGKNKGKGKETDSSDSKKKSKKGSSKSGKNSDDHSSPPKHHGTSKSSKSSSSSSSSSSQEQRKPLMNKMKSSSDGGSSGSDDGLDSGSYGDDNSGDGNDNSSDSSSGSGSSSSKGKGSSSGSGSGSSKGKGSAGDDGSSANSSKGTSSSGSSGSSSKGKSSSSSGKGSGNDSSDQGIDSEDGSGDGSGTKSKSGKGGNYKSDSSKSGGATSGNSDDAGGNEASSDDGNSSSLGPDASSLSSAMPTATAAYTTTVPVLATWSSGSSTWTATQAWSTAVVTPNSKGSGKAKSTSSAGGSDGQDGSPSQPQAAPLATPTPSRKDQINAQNILSASSKAVAAAQAMQTSGPAFTAPSLANGASIHAATSNATVGDLQAPGSSSDDSGRWLSPAPGQIFSGGQDVVLSW